MILVVVLWMQSILFIMITTAVVIASPNHNNVAAAAAAVTNVGENVAITTVTHSSLSLSSSSSQHRSLNRLDIFLYETDECENGPNQFGRCNTSRFPDCLAVAQQQQSQMLLYPCYNRKPHRSTFWPDHHPRYYIQYDRVACLPPDTICSSCSPGRLCESERRCILDELIYNCSHWF